jgi:hypothetical protein
MNIQRIRRESVYDEGEVCDFCDQSACPGYRFMGSDDIMGPRGSHLTVCDDCLAKTRRSRIGFWNDRLERPSEENL